MSYTIVKKFKFDAGHRVMGHEGKCRTPHGHEYKVLVHARAEAGALDELGRVIDFSVLKDRIGKWIDEKWDHTFLVYSEDDEMVAALDGIVTHKPIFVCQFNPTVENLAWHLLKKVCPGLMDGTGVEIAKIEMWETETSHVEVVP